MKKILGCELTEEQEKELESLRKLDKPKVYSSFCDGGVVHNYGPVLMLSVASLLDRVEALESQIENLQYRLDKDRE